jgi:hypothetical protein
MEIEVLARAVRWHKHMLFTMRPLFSLKHAPLKLPRGRKACLTAQVGTTLNKMIQEERLLGKHVTATKAGDHLFF